MMGKAYHIGVRLSMNNFKSGQLCSIVKNAYDSNLPDSDVSYNRIYVSRWDNGISRYGDLIPEGTPVLIIQPLEAHCKVLIWDNLYFIKKEALEDL
jgi:hypothetical protein